MSVRRTLKVFLGGLAGAAAAIGAWIPGWHRITPEERERMRRLAVNANGRLGSAMITDFRDGIVSYRYVIGGVEYAASQDVSTLWDLIPPNPYALTERPAGLKYLPRNPANSILLCEKWSGLQLLVPLRAGQTADLPPPR